MHSCNENLTGKEGGQNEADLWFQTMLA